MSEPPTAPPPAGNPTLGGAIGLGLLLLSVFLGRGADAGVPVYVARTLFFVGLAVIVAAVSLWYRQAQHPEKERDPEV
jgi:hypothetical protein